MDESAEEIQYKLTALTTDLAQLIQEAEGVPGFTGPYGPNPPLPESDLVTFEQTHAITLPVEYREFLLRFGNGGRWPWLKQEPFGGIGPTPWRAWDVRVGEVAEQFPHTVGWNDPSGEPIYRDEWDGDPTFVRLELEWKQRYFSKALLNGAIPLHNHGCARYSWLVVTGPLAGGVWFDCRVDRLGIYPITDCDGMRVRFLNWMLIRVDYARQWIRREKTRADNQRS